jgi:hypothetical protein
VGAAAGPELSGALWVPATKAAGLQGLRILDLCHTAVRTAPTPVSFTLDRYGHQTIPGPVAEGQCHPVGD